MGVLCRLKRVLGVAGRVKRRHSSAVVMLHIGRGSLYQAWSPVEAYQCLGFGLALRPSPGNDAQPGCPQYLDDVTGLSA
jgi:hypothetical protein